MKAVEQKPDFDIALANLGNAIKDVGRPWDAIAYYRRAARVDPTLPEAVCGLVNSLSSICDWHGRGAVAGEVGVDDGGYVIPPSPYPQTGWITNMAAVTDAQIAQGYAPGVGAPTLNAAMEECLRALAVAQGRALTPGELATWQARLERLVRRGEGVEGGERGERVNEAGFLIRFIDWVQPRLQRRWYLRAYGKTLAVDEAAATSEENYHGFYLRPTLPKTLQPPPVPSVLPFHTVRRAHVWLRWMCLHVLLAVHVPADTKGEPPHPASKRVAIIVHRARAAVAPEARLPPATATDPREA